MGSFFVFTTAKMPNEVCILPSSKAFPSVTPNLNLTPPENKILKSKDNILTLPEGYRY